MERTPLPSDRLTPHPDRCPTHRPDYAEILHRHAQALAAAHPTYLDPRTGFLVFTAQALWDQGACCDSGCRHCPFVERPDSP